VVWFDFPFSLVWEGKLVGLAGLGCMHSSMVGWVGFWFGLVFGPLTGLPETCLAPIRSTFSGGPAPPALLTSAPNAASISKFMNEKNNSMDKLESWTPRAHSSWSHVES
jgi:hypothetical protein